MDREELYVRVRWPFRSAARWYEEYRRVAAVWGLTTPARDALPFALEMLRSRNPEVRADATSVLERLRGDDRAIAELIPILETERELEPLDAAIGALERLRAQEGCRRSRACFATRPLTETPGSASPTRWLRSRERGFRRHEPEDALAWLDDVREG